MKHIRIISPSGVIDPAYIEQASSRLRAWGYKVSEGAYARAQWGRFAGTDEQRASDLNAALADNDVDFILCSRGGYGLQRIIDRIAPIGKPIIGFSDITALHQLSAYHDQFSIHGIMCKHIATLPEESEPIMSLRRLLADERMDYHWPAHPLNQLGTAYAPIVGGNLSVCGVLAHLSGLIVGQFSDCEDDPGMGCSIYETIKEAVADYDYPILFNAPVGHVEHNLPLRLHSTIRMDVTPDGASITGDSFVHPQRHV